MRIHESPAFELVASDTGWFLGRLGTVNVAHIGDGLTDSSFAAYLAALDSDLERRGTEAPSTVFYDTTSPLQMSSMRRRAVADVLERHRELRARVTLGYALSTPSTLGFTVMTALFWMTPPPYPTRIVGSARDAFDFLAQCDPRVDSAVHAERWARLCVDHRDETGEFAVR